MPKERNKADGYREKAYEGDTKAMNNLGVCYERGTGVKVSLELAFEWYMKAAELGDVYGYTGITRAKKLCIIVGTTKALAYAIHNMVVLKRNTRLKERLTDKSNKQYE